MAVFVIKGEKWGQSRLLCKKEERVLPCLKEVGLGVPRLRVEKGFFRPVMQGRVSRGMCGEIAGFKISELKLIILIS
jgi:hypothetical protein